MSIPMQASTVRLVSNSDSISALFSKNRHYIVPEYQRDYSWGENEIEDFVSSLKRCLDNQDVFMGTVQFARDGQDTKIYEIIDGQQRMTTFLLLCHVLDLLIASDSGIVEQNKIQLEIRNFASNADKLAAALSISYDNIKKFGNSQQEQDENRYGQNLQLLKRAVEEILYDNNEHYITAKELLEAVISKIYFVELITTNIPLPEVVSIFKTINTTGLDLNCADLFKLQYYEYLKKNYPKEKNWIQKISDCYEKVNSQQLDMQQVLDIYKHCLVAQNKLKWGMLSLSHEKFFDSVLNISQKISCKIDHHTLSFDEFMRLIDLYIDFSAQLKDPNSLLSQQASTDALLAVELIKLTRYTRYWTLPFVQAFFACQTDGPKEQRLQKYITALAAALPLAKYFIVCSVNYDKVIHSVQTYICDTILPLMASEKSVDFAAAIAARIEKSPNTDEDSSDTKNREWFCERLSQNLFDNKKRSRIVCTLSAVLEEKNAGSNITDIRRLLFDWQSNPYDMDHIYAQELFKKHDSVNAPFYNSIGNLVILERSINRTAQDDSAEKKAKQYYDKSNFVSARMVAKQIKSTPEQKWDIAQVKMRLTAQKKMLCEYLGLNIEIEE